LISLNLLKLRSAVLHIAVMASFH